MIKLYMFIIGSYHKTGTVLFKNIFNKYKERNDRFNYQFYDHFNRVDNNTIKNNKCLVIIRHPYEIIISGVRFHQITDEKWCHQPTKNLGGNTYQQHIKSLPDDKKILFEMGHFASYTIKNIYNDVKNRNFNNNILFLKLEDLYIKENIPDICQKIKDHFKVDEVDGEDNVNLDELISCFNECLNIPYHRTHEKNEYTYQKHFKPTHFNRIKKLFPDDLLKVLGY